MPRHLELMPPSERSAAIGKLRRAGVTISPNATAKRIAISVAKALRLDFPRSITEGAILVRQYIRQPEVPTGYGEPRNWVVYKQPLEMTRALARAADPYARQPGDGR